MTESRSIVELRRVIGALDEFPVMASDVVEAYHEGLITKAETKLLAVHSRRTPRRQRRVEAGQKPVTDADIEQMRAKLEAAEAKLNALLRNEGDR